MLHQSNERRFEENPENQTLISEFQSQYMKDEIKCYVMSRLFNNLLFVVDQYGYYKLYLFLNRGAA